MPEDYKPKAMTNAERDHVMYEAILRLDKLEKAHNNLAMLVQKLLCLIYAEMEISRPESFASVVSMAMDGEKIRVIGQKLGAEEIKIIAALEAKKKEGVV